MAATILAERIKNQSREKEVTMPLLIRQRRFSDFSRIRDYAAKCGDFEAEKLQNWWETDSLAVDGV